eukprot:751239-Hanusia_phi.AAC.2
MDDISSPPLFRLASGWPALKKWSFDYFSAGDVGGTQTTSLPSDVRMRRGIGRISDTSGDSPQGAARKPPDRLCRGWTYEKDFPDLIEDFKVSHDGGLQSSPLLRRVWPDPGVGERLVPTASSKGGPLLPMDLSWAWRLQDSAACRSVEVGGDVEDTTHFVAKIVGRKRFILYRPGHLKHLFDENVQSGGKTVDVREPNKQTFPSFDEATPYEVVLHPGDVIFVPAGWAHQVECVDDSISLTHNFLPKHNFSAIRACMLANRLGKVVEARRKESVVDNSNS